MLALLYFKNFINLMLKCYKSVRYGRIIESFKIKALHELSRVVYLILYALTV